MPYYRRRRYPYRKTVFRKKWYGRRKKYAKTLSMAQVTKDGKRFFKLRVATNFTSSALGTLDTVVDNNPSGFQDWSSISNLFDSYRVCAIKIKYIPSLPNDTSAVTGFYPLYAVNDHDDITPLASVNQAIQYENMKVHNLYMPWQHYFKIPVRTQTSTAGTIEKGGYQDIASVSGSAGIKLWVTGLDTSTQYGTMIVTHYIAAKNRR